MLPGPAPDAAQLDLLFRAALRQILETRLAHRRPDILEAADMGAVYALLEQRSDLDLVLLDLDMPGAHGLSGLANLRGSWPALRASSACASTPPCSAAWSRPAAARGCRKASSA